MWQTSLRLGASVALAAMFFIGIALGQQAANEHVLYNFTGGNDGAFPGAGLTFDRSGNLYGNTNNGGQYGEGVIYEISHSSNGPQFTVLYAFQGGLNDGQTPSGQLAISANGTIFGVTEQGETNDDGMIFSLTPSGDTWTEKILYVFPSVVAAVNSGLIIDSEGNLYGETAFGGTHNQGTVYELRPTGTGYTFAVLYNFAGGSDGHYPSGGLVMDADGNVYGTTSLGGLNTYGDVFELKRNGNGTWTESILYTFQSIADGENPQSSLVFDSSGNLYGTTQYGGDTSCGGGNGCGEIFELMNAGDGVWTKTTLYAFTGRPDGDVPDTNVVFDKAGNLFGTTLLGGRDNDGTVFKLSPSSGGWTEKIIHSFTNGNDGAAPAGPPVFNANGDLFGTTGFGGQYHDGVVFAFFGLGGN